MKQKGINFNILLKNYKKGWVGISRDFKKVVVYGKTLASTMKKAARMKEKPYYFPSGQAYSNYIGTAYHANYH